MNDHAIAHDTHGAAALDLALLHIAAGDGAHAGDFVGLTDLDPADDGLRNLGRACPSWPPPFH